MHLDKHNINLKEHQNLCHWNGTLKTMADSFWEQKQLISPEFRLTEMLLGT